MADPTRPHTKAPPSGLFVADKKLRTASPGGRVQGAGDGEGFPWNTIPPQDMTKNPTPPRRSAFFRLSLSSLDASGYLGKDSSNWARLVQDPAQAVKFYIYIDDDPDGFGYQYLDASTDMRLDASTGLYAGFYHSRSYLSYDQRSLTLSCDNGAGPPLSKYTLADNYLYFDPENGYLTVTPQEWP